MKKITLFWSLLLFSTYSFAQNTIDPKYKKPSLGINTSKTSTTVIKEQFNKDLLVKVYGKSQAEKMYDKYNSEYKAFDQNGDEVWIYADMYFNGEKKILKVGNYTLLGGNTTKELGVNWNDKISSMLIPVSLKVTVFMDDKFGGLGTSTSGYGVKNMETGAIGFRGDYYTFESAGKYSKGGLYFITPNQQFISANDNISSIKIYK